jgi:hypothetical protein
MFLGVRLFVPSVLIVLFCFGLAACGSGEDGSKGFNEPDEPVPERSPSATSPAAATSPIPPTSLGCGGKMTMF